MTEELKPCPFCGGTDIQSQADFVHCSDCGGQIDYSCETEPQRSTAISAWNRRADGWISVEDRLPEPNAWILIYINFGTCGSTAIGRYVELYHSVFVWFNDVLGKKTDLVTHWQPLPGPPTK